MTMKIMPWFDIKKEYNKPRQQRDSFNKNQVSIKIKIFVLLS